MPTDTYGLTEAHHPQSALDQLREQRRPDVKSTPKRPKPITDKVVLEIFEELEQEIASARHEASNVRGMVTYRHEMLKDDIGKVSGGVLELKRQADSAKSWAFGAWVFAAVAMVIAIAVAAAR